MRRFFPSLLVLVALVAALGMPERASAIYYSFGSDPYTDVLNAAATKYQQIGLTKNEFAAIMLAPTWPETAENNPANTPSPMTLGRGDVIGAGLLYYNGITGPSNPYPQAFWHAGVGAWQFDSAGVGSSLSTWEQNIHDHCSRSNGRDYRQ